MRAVDQAVVLLLTANMAVTANTYKQRLQKNSKVFDMLIEELPVPKVDTPEFINLFRVTREIDFEGMRNTFMMNSAQGEKYKLIKICIDNYNDIVRLQKFYSLIEFTNALLPMFNHMIRREEARLRPIKDFFTDDEAGTQLKGLFQAFLKDWNSISFDNL